VRLWPIIASYPWRFFHHLTVKELGSWPALSSSEIANYVNPHLYATFSEFSAGKFSQILTASKHWGFAVFILHITTLQASSDLHYILPIPCSSPIILLHLSVCFDINHLKSFLKDSVKRNIKICLVIIFIVT
jgi:hypothetical protein